MSDLYEEFHELVKETINFTKDEYEVSEKQPDTPQPSSMIDSIHTHLPHISLKKPILPKGRVAILVFEETDIPFLKNLAKAIQTHLCPVKLIHAKRLKDPNSLHFQFLIVQKSCSLTFSNDMTLIVLDPIQEYEKNIQKKKELWISLCQKLKIKSSVSS